MEFVPYAKKVTEELADNPEELDNFRKTVRHFFEKALLEGRVSLAEHGPNLDEQRKSIDTVVIHHTSAKPGYRLSYMNAVQLLNVYAPYFAAPLDMKEKSLKGQPIWSNHVKDRRQIFYLYHWLVRMDGSVERLLSDNQIGWHAGNWDINKRSVAICLDNDYENQDPTDEILQKLAAHIRRSYPQASIIGHCEARTGTICPGTHFIDRWKDKLLSYLEVDKRHA